MDDFFRFLRATDRDFVKAHTPTCCTSRSTTTATWARSGGATWEPLAGPLRPGALFEYAATLGLLDVAYLSPHGTRTRLPRPLGCRRPLLPEPLRQPPVSCASTRWARGVSAWRRRRSAGRDTAVVVQVLPNLDVVATAPPLAASDRLLLERYAEPQSEAVWELDAGQGPDRGGRRDAVGGVGGFPGGPQRSASAADGAGVSRRHEGPGRAVATLGLALLLLCADATVARQLAGDPQLRERCRLAGENWLVFCAADETAVRRVLRRLGYVLPPARE